MININREPDIICPTCQKTVDAPDPKTTPFCSVRCQQIDLSRWLGEAYALPLDGHEEVDELVDPSDDLN